MKEQGKNPTDQTNEEEIGSLPEKEFRVMIVKMIQNLGNRMEKIQDTSQIFTTVVSAVWLTGSWCSSKCQA